MTRLFYIHGAGRQENRLLLKRRLDGILFGANMLERTVMGYYSDLLHDEDDVPDALEAADPEMAEIDKAFMLRAAEVAAAELAEGSGEPPPALEGITMPDPAFFLLAGIASQDVKKYLKGGSGPAIRDRILELFPEGPVVVVAHSLGTIVAYDVIASFAGTREIPLLVTLGSPLGFGNVQKRLHGGATPPPAPVPSGITKWHNLADPHDPVALEQTLADEFTPPAFVHDTQVDNPALLNHDLTGYLGTTEVQELVRSAMG